MDLVSARMKALLEYIEEQARVVQPDFYNLAKVGGFQSTPKTTSSLPGVVFDSQSQGDHVWLRVERLEATKPPEIPEEQLSSGDHFKEFLHVPADPRAEGPQIDDKMLGAVALEAAGIYSEVKARDLHQKVVAEVEQSFAKYAQKWRTWAALEVERLKTIKLYAEFFALRQQMEIEQTNKPVELVWGMGLASWHVAFGETKPIDVSYPLLTQGVEIAIDEKSLALELRPRATPPQVELTPYISAGVPRAIEVEKTIEAELDRASARPINPFDPGSTLHILQTLAGNLDVAGRFEEHLLQKADLPPPGESLIVTDLWCIFARTRSNNHLVEDLRRLVAKLVEGAVLPAGPASLVSEPSDDSIVEQRIEFRGISTRGSSKNARDLFFPLPSNEEQVTVMERLETCNGVTVQGPPGTGKSHTITNIICHYLATGRRVLVTAKGEPALKVLQSKIPEAVRPLTVALLVDDREGMRQFQASIETIQHRVSQLDSRATQDSIDRNMAAIDETHRSLIEIDRRVDQIAGQQLSNISVDGTEMRAERAAQLVVSGASHYGWMDDILSLDAKYAPPLSSEDANRLRTARRNLGADLNYIGVRLPKVDELAAPDQVGALHDTLSQVKRFDAQVNAGELLSLRIKSNESIERIRLLAASVATAQPMVENIALAVNGWTQTFRANCRKREFQSERQAFEALLQDASRLIEARLEFLKRPVAIPDRGLKDPVVRQAIAKAAATGKPFGFISTAARESKECVAQITISGLAPASADEWTHVQRFQALHDEIVSFATRWNVIAQQLGIPQLTPTVAALRELEQTCDLARQAHQLAIGFDAQHISLAESLFEKAPTERLVTGLPDLKWWREQIASHLARADLAGAANLLAGMQNKVADTGGEISEQLRHLLANVLGDVDTTTAQVMDRYAALLVRLRELTGKVTDLNTVSELSSRFKEAGGENLARRLLSVPVTGPEDATFPGNWHDAWNWARLRSYLESIEARDELVALAGRRVEMEHQLAKLYESVVTESAWLKTKANASARTMAALAGYATAVRRIGQGTGPNAVRYRQDARKAMLDAAPAVPCWIMSHSKVSESLPATFDGFDLVIVDEASQSDLWALPAVVRGKKVLVVGDERQVSPDGGFKDSNRIVELRERFLRDQPFGVEMTPEKSLYDLAARVFAAQQVMLREHFRCVTPIIAYSNQTFYQGGIRPLRVPKASERIDPPLVDIYVPDGYRGKRDTNRQEAEAIAAEISALIKDERLTGRSIGVVSLLGMGQAKMINDIVFERCPAKELYARNFACGEPRTFQGSERDIMFLSMVVDRSSCSALSGSMFDQRFNVAASRARDRMYLVRSVEQADLSQKDLRLTLLRHFDQPVLAGAENTEDLLKLCDSGFEREVFTMLVGRGYKVTPQVKAGAFSIDMVVEGLNDARLAIELDGDDFHGPDRWPADMSRQRVLERAGWTFWRCFASSWALAKDQIFIELLAKLDSMGIGPIGASDSLPMLVEKRTWRAAETGAEQDALNEPGRVVQETADVIPLPNSIDSATVLRARKVVVVRKPTS